MTHLELYLHIHRFWIFNEVEGEDAILRSFNKGAVSHVRHNLLFFYGYRILYVDPKTFLEGIAHFILLIRT